MDSAPPPAYGIRPYGDSSFRVIDLSQPPHGGPRHLQLPTKHDEYYFCGIEDIMNKKTRLIEVAAAGSQMYEMSIGFPDNFRYFFSKQ
jgi:hypothetical protein